MPTSYTIDVARRLVWSRAWGNVTDADLLDHQGRLARDPRFKSDFSQLADFLEVTDLTGVTSNGIKQLAQEHLYGPNSRRAFVALNTEVFGLTRMFATHRELSHGREQIRVFESLEDACVWLGVPGAPMPARA